jgi:hypothetical protein
MAHADFGGATLAVHVVAVKKIDPVVLTPTTAPPCTLFQVISTTAHTFGSDIDALPALNVSVLQAPIIHLGEMMHLAGLWDFTSPMMRVGCHLVFKWSGLVQR